MSTRTCGQSCRKCLCFWKLELVAPAMTQYTNSPLAWPGTANGPHSVDYASFEKQLSVHSSGRHLASAIHVLGSGKGLSRRFRLASMGRPEEQSSKAFVECFPICASKN